MVWLFVIGLGVWVFVQGRKIAGLERRINDLSALPHTVRPVFQTPPAQPAAPPPEPPEPPRPEAIAPEVIAPGVVVPPTPAPELEPIHAAPVEALAPASPPLPPPPVIEEWRPPPLVAEVPAMRARALSEPAPRAAQPAAPAPPFSHARPPPPPIAPRRPKPEPEGPRLSASAWLAENGLAWLGGGALMLGGLFLVVYAAQRGFFTPPLRIGAAILVGLVMLAVSEWVRRRPDEPGSRHPLAAAALAGAGASTLYAAFWSAFALYHLIGLPVAAGLIAATSIGLLALALLHGEALGVLALIGALLAPAVTGLAQWDPGALDAYLMAVTATGFAASALRRWGAVGGLTLIAVVLWSVTTIAQKNDLFGAALLLAGVVGPAAGVLWRRRAETETPPADLFSALPTLALIAASLVSIQFWALGKPAAVHHGLGLAIVLTLLAAALARRGVAHLIAFPAPAAAAALTTLAALPFLHTAPPSLEQTLWIGLAAALAAGALAFGRRAGPQRDAFLGIGAIGAAVLANLLWVRLELATAGAWPSWSAPAALTLLLAAGAALLARDATEPTNDRAVGLWIASAAETLYLAVHAATPDAFAPAAEALAALVFAALAARLGWRGLASAAAAGAVVALAEMFKPAFVFDVLHGHMPLALLGGVTVAAAGLVFAGSRLIKPRIAIAADGMATTALAIALMGGFFGLHRLVAGPTPGVGLEPLLEASLRTDLLLAAGLALAFRTGEESGPIARWRLAIVLGLGVLNGVVAQGLVFNPWWGMGEAPAGPPLLNTLALDYLAPAALLALIARRRFAGSVPGTKLAAVAAFGFAFVWGLLEIRRDFHGVAMTVGDVGRAEGAAYGLLWLAAAFALAWVRRRAGETPGAMGYLAAIAQPFAWVGLALSTLAVTLYANPLWGPIETPVTSTEAALIAGALVLAAAGAFGLARTAWDDHWPTLSRTAMVVVVFDAFVLALLLLRGVFHFPALAVGDVSRVEGGAYGLLFLVTALGLAWLKRRVGDTPRATAYLAASAQPFGWLALSLCALALVGFANPWWGPDRTPLAGPGEAALILGGLAAGAAGSLAFSRLTWPAEWRALSRIAMATALLHGLVLAVLLVRMNFHGLAPATGDVTRLEGAAYGLLLLATALGLAWLDRRLGDKAGASAYLTDTAQPFAWLAIALAGLALGFYASPWWGPIETPLSGPVEALLIFVAIGAGAAATLALGRFARLGAWPILPQAATSVGVAELFVLVTLVVRWLYRGPDMRAAVREASVETWTFSAVWAVFGLAVLITGGARRDVTLRWLGLIALIGTVVKVLAFDTARLDGMIRAGSWLAVGALLITGALTARRLNADGAAFFRLKRAAPEPEPTAE